MTSRKLYFGRVYISEIEYAIKTNPSYIDGGGQRMKWVIRLNLLIFRVTSYFSLGLGPLI